MKEPKLTELECVIELDNMNKYAKQHIQIQRIEGQGNVNNFLLSIPRENVIDIKPMKHNTYLVIYAKEEHDGGMKYD